MQRVCVQQYRRQNKTRPDNTGLDTIRQEAIEGKARQDKTTPDNTKHNKTTQDTTGRPKEIAVCPPKNESDSNLEQ